MFVPQDEVGAAVLEAEQERSCAQHLTAAQHEAQVKVFRSTKFNYKCTWYFVLTIGLAFTSLG